MAQSPAASEGEPVCSNCQKIVGIGMKFCPNCGHCPNCGGNKGPNGNPANVISSKVTASTLGAAFATLAWFFIANYGWLPANTSPEDIATLAGATGTFVAFGAGYLVRDPRRK